MLELFLELLLDLIAFVSIIGLILTWHWERTAAAQSARSSQPAQSAVRESEDHDAPRSAFRKAG